MASERKRYRVTMRRKGSASKIVYTQAASPAQALRFVHVKHRGWSAKRATHDPARRRSKRNPVRVRRGTQDVVETIGKAHQLKYKHLADGKNYVHDFGGTVIVQALRDGSLRLYHPRRKLWGDFNV